MKILNEREAFLLDFEVLQHLKDYKEKYNWLFSAEDDAKFKGRKKRFTGAGLGLEVMTRDVLLYTELRSAATITSKLVLLELMTYLNTLDLMKIEKLQIVNSLPRSMVHLYGLVEECDQRFDEATCEALLEKVNELVPLPEEEEAEEEEAEAEEEAVEEAVAGADAAETEEVSEEIKMEVD